MGVEGTLIKTPVDGFIPLFANKKEVEEQAFGRRVLPLRR
jgi:hypothetical protein